jgi:hypothetical protein
MSNTSQKRAIKNYRNRLHKRGMARFEVLGLDADRDLIRSLARRLAEDGPDASRLRSAVSQTIGGEPPRKGGIVEALRRSPLVGADIAVARPANSAEGPSGPKNQASGDRFARLPIVSRNPWFPEFGTGRDAAAADRGSGSS